MKRYFLRIAAFFALIILSIGPASAWFWNDWFGSNYNVSDELNEIDMRADLLGENTQVMKFINSNMFDQGVDVVEISIKNDNEILKTYYIMRAENKKGIASIAEIAPENMNVVWKFKPGFNQALDGLDLAADGLIILEQSNRSTFDVTIKALKGLQLYYTVENENVPPFSELVNKSNCRKCKEVLNWIGISTST
jgi:hypothetical protein